MSAVIKSADFLDAAVAMSIKYPVFPCNPDKSPRTRNGFKDATRDLSQILDWWTQHPDSLVGVPTGAASGLFVIDDDTAKKPDPASTAWLEANRADLESTHRYPTRSGGAHYLFQIQGLELGNHTGITVDAQKLKAIDTRGEGGYIIYWPAHGSASTGEVQPLSPALIAQLCEPKVPAAPAGVVPPVPTSMPSGNWVWNTTALELPAALAYLDPNDSEEWLTVGMCIKHAANSAEDAYQLFDRWSKGEFTANGEQPSGYNPLENRKRWDSFGKDAKKKPKTIKSIFKLANKRGYEKAKMASPASLSGDARPVIELLEGAFDKYAEQAEQLLAEIIYVRAEGLVRIGRAAEISNAALEDGMGIKRDAAQAICIPATADWLRRALMKRATFWQFDKRGHEWQAKDCPRELSENISNQRSWATFRPLVTITAVPFLRDDMSVCKMPGYDAATGVYYQPTIEFPPMLPAPTRDDALQALARLREPFAEFPFASPEAEAGHLSNVITTILRPGIDTTPITFYTAPNAASGKTLLASTPSLIANGMPAAQNPYSEKEELRKVLFSCLLAGDVALTLDNVPDGATLDSDVLCGFVTSDIYSDRILGKSSRRQLPNRLSVSMTGNNITPSGATSRRAIVVRLEVNAESARGRKFRIADLKAHLIEHRAQLIVDVLTIVRAYALAGRPAVAHPLESFEKWSRVVRDPLVWLGMADPVNAQATETDDDVAPLRAAFAALAKVTATVGHAFTAAQLAPMISLCGDATVRPKLIETGCIEPTDSKQLGPWLRSHKGRVAGGWKLTQPRSAGGGVALWMLLPVQP